jgi:DNA-binding NtrC family response regulator
VTGALRSSSRPARERGGAPRVHVVSPDPGFSGKGARRLQGWGASVAVDRDLARLTAPAPGAQPDVVLLDVRREDDALLGGLALLKRAQPGVEVILLNLPGQVGISIAAMRAGASSELPAPVDLAALHATVSASLRRRGKRLRARRPSLLERFQRAMTAATFAQAGEFETARELLDEEQDPPPRGGPRGRHP